MSEKSIMSMADEILGGALTDASQIEPPTQVPQDDELLEVPEAVHEQLMEQVAPMGPETGKLPTSPRIKRLKKANPASAARRAAKLPNLKKGSVSRKPAAKLPNLKKDLWGRPQEKLKKDLWGRKRKGKTSDAKSVDSKPYEPNWHQGPEDSSARIVGKMSTSPRIQRLKDKGGASTKETQTSKPKKDLWGRPQEKLKKDLWGRKRKGVDEQHVKPVLGKMTVSPRMQRLKTAHPTPRQAEINKQQAQKKARLKRGPITPEMSAARAAKSWPSKKQPSNTQKPSFPTSPHGKFKTDKEGNTLFGPGKNFKKPLNNEEIEILQKAKDIMSEMTAVGSIGVNMAGGKSQSGPSPSHHPAMSVKLPGDVDVHKAIKKASKAPKLKAKIKRKSNQSKDDETQAATHQQMKDMHLTSESHKSFDSFVDGVMEKVSVPQNPHAAVDKVSKAGPSNDTFGGGGVRTGGRGPKVQLTRNQLMKASKKAKAKGQGKEKPGFGKASSHSRKHPQNPYAGSI